MGVAAPRMGGRGSPHGGFVLPAWRFSLPTQSHRDTEDFGVRGSAPILKHRPAFAFFAAKITDLLPLLPFVAKKLLLHLYTSTRLNILNRAEHEERVEKCEALHVSTRSTRLKRRALCVSV